MLERVRNVITRMLLAVVVCSLTVAMVTGCASDEAGDASYTKVEPVQVNVAALTFAPSAPFLSFMQRASEGQTHNSFAFATVGTWDIVAGALLDGSADIGVVQPTVAARLYFSDEYDVSMISVSSLGSYAIMTKSKGVHEPSDLAGKTIYTGGSGMLANQALDEVLGAYDLRDKVTIEPRANAIAATAEAVSHPESVVMLEQPYVSDVMATDKKLKYAFSLSDEWDKLDLDGARLVEYVVVVRNDFLQAHPEAVEEFLREQQLSTELVNEDPSGLVDAADTYHTLNVGSDIEAGLRLCYSKCITGEEMRDVLTGYYERFLPYASYLIGNAIPGDDFYYLGPDAGEDEEQSEEADDSSQDASGEDGEAEDESVADGADEDAA